MERFHKPRDERIVAYFSMEIGVDERIPTYSGGLGVLAGDTIKSAADLNVPMVAVTLLNEKGYFYQKLDDDGTQAEKPVEWSVDDFLNLLEPTVELQIEGRKVQLRVWELRIKGIKGYEVPIYYLDSNVESNSEYDRTLTNHLYGGDSRYRLHQEMVLGIGGVRMLAKLGHDIHKFHMNEGHSALLSLELFSKFKDLGEVRKRCVFTTHTPVPAGHDQFEKNLVEKSLGTFFTDDMRKFAYHEGKLNMTCLALSTSMYVNGVAKKHGEVSRSMFPGYPIDSITNGVYSRDWTSPHFKRLFNEYVPGWVQDPFTLRYALAIPDTKIWEAHMQAKKQLIDFVNSRTNSGMDYDHFTIGFARRATGYKRADLLFYDIEKLKKIAEKNGPIQVIFGGKAHPSDGSGKDIIKKIFSRMHELKNTKISIAYVENYNIGVAKLLVAGVDLWLNTPMRPREASGTSGMKACHNGVPNLSVLDGWWCEGHIENVTGWSIGPKGDSSENDSGEDALDLYYKLELILPLFYTKRDEWIDVMKQSIAFNASFFNTHRMVHQYVLNAYFHQL